MGGWHPPQTGSVIPPRPSLSIVLQDANGIDTEFLTITKQKDGGPLESITDYEIRTQSGFQTVPIDYQPILFPGEHTFTITAQDFNGNTIGGDAGVVTYRFLSRKPQISYRLRLTFGLPRPGQVQPVTPLTSLDGRHSAYRTIALHNYAYGR